MIRVFLRKGRGVNDIGKWVLKVSAIRVGVWGRALCQKGRGRRCTGLWSQFRSRVTAAPRVAARVLAALPRLMATSKKPLEPRMRTGSLGAPLPKVCANLEISALPTRI